MAAHRVDMMSESRKRDKLILAIKRCIVASFSQGDWDELAYLADSRDIVYEHPRLLRSLSFGDDDYESCVLEAVESMADRHPENLQVIADFIGLPQWLEEYYPQDLEELYGHTPPLLNALARTAIASSFELDQYIARIRRAVESDPELAVGSTKEMLESVLKTVVAGFGEDVGGDDLPRLLKRVQKKLELDPSDVAPSAKGAEIVKRTLSNLSQIVVGVDELRNLYGTGHGKVRKSGISPRHARLVVGAGATLATFLMETYEIRKGGRMTMITGEGRQCGSTGEC